MSPIDELRARYAAIEWFTPPTTIDGVERFLAYHRMAFDWPVEIVEVAGGWDEFAALCHRARTERHDWDWKFTGLKPLTRRHSELHGWMGPEIADDTEAPQPGALFWRYRGSVIWLVQAPPLAGEVPEAGRFYKEYADLELICGIEWQLAEPTCALADNPFAALLHVYAGRYYPLHFGRRDVTLFHFV